MKNPVIIATVIFIAAVLWIMSGQIFPSEKHHEEKPDDVPAAKTMQVQIRDLTAETYTSRVKVTGRTKASRVVDLKAEVDGQVIELLADKGDRVQAGQIIARIDKKDRTARVAEMRQTVNQRNIEYNAASKLEEEGFYPKTRLAQSAADLAAAKANLKQAELTLDKTEIKAPFDGVIGGRMIEIGDYTTIGTPLLTVVDLDPMKLQGFLSEKVVLDVAANAKATGNLLNGEKVEGIVTFVSPVADQTTRTFPVEISLPNPDQRIVEGLTAEIHISTTEKKAHRVSPSALTLNDGGQVGVKIVNDQNIVEFIPVVMLSDDPDSIWIGGVPDTFRLITIGQEFVIPGQVVDPVQSKEKDGLL